MQYCALLWRHQDAEFLITFDLSSGFSTTMALLWYSLPLIYKFQPDYLVTLRYSDFRAQTFLRELPMLD